RTHPPKPRAQASTSCTRSDRAKRTIWPLTSAGLAAPVPSWARPLRRQLAQAGAIRADDPQVGTRTLWRRRQQAEVGDVGGGHATEGEPPSIARPRCSDDHLAWQVEDN